MAKKDLNDIMFRRKKVANPSPSAGQADIKRQLKSIYRDRGGKMPNFSRLERKRSSFFKFVLWLLVFAALVFLGVMAVSFYLFGGSNSGKFTSERVLVEMEAPEEASSGDKFSLEVFYSNDEDVSLTKSRLVLRVPDAFSLAKAFPDPTDEFSWELGTLLPGKRGSVILEGTLVDDIGAKERFSADLVYWPENFHSEFHEQASVSVILAESTIGASVTSEEVVAVEEEFSYLFEVENTTEEDIERLQVEFSYPSGFIILESDPEPDESDKFWKIAKLKAGEKEEIEVKGSYRPSSSSGTKKFLATVSVFSEDLDGYVAQKEVTYAQKLAKDDLALNLLANDSTEDSAIEFGSRVGYSLVWSNKGDTDIASLKVRLRFSSDIVDWLAFTAPADSRLEGTTLYWDLDEGLKSGDEGVIQLTLPIIANPEEADGDNFAVRAEAQASLDAGNSWTKSSNAIINRITSSISLSGTARFRDSLGNVVGNGTFPPEAGKETTYQLVYTLDNGLSEIGTIELAIPLGSLAEFSGGVNVSSGTVSYDASAHQAVWRIGRVPGGVSGLRASFLVSVTPTAEDLAAGIVLASTASLSAQDRVLGDSVTQTVAAVAAPTQ